MTNLSGPTQHTLQPPTTHTPSRTPGTGPVRSPPSRLPHNPAGSKTPVSHHSGPHAPLQGRKCAMRACEHMAQGNCAFCWSARCIAAWSGQAEGNMQHTHYQCTRMDCLKCRSMAAHLDRPRGVGDVCQFCKKFPRLDRCVATCGQPSCKQALDEHNRQVRNTGRGQYIRYRCGKPGCKHCDTRDESVKITGGFMQTLRG